MEQTLKQFEKEGAIDAATRFAALADQQEQQQNYEGAMISNLKANEQYLKAMAMIKQHKNHDQETVKSLEMLAETHRRKAKLLETRKEINFNQSKSKIDEMILAKKEEKKRQKALKTSPGQTQGTQPEQDKEKELNDLLKQQLVILNSTQFHEVKSALENSVKYQMEKLQKFEVKFGEILELYTKAFSEQTKELILSYGDKFVNVQSNPFAQDALKESINLSKIQKNTQKFKLFIDAIKKFRSKIEEVMSKILLKVDEMNQLKNTFELNYGQLAALASTPVGQNIGLMQSLYQKNKNFSQILDPYIQELRQQEAMAELDQSVVNEKRGGSQMKPQQMMDKSHQNELQQQVETMERVIQQMNAKIQSQQEDNKQLGKKLEKYKKLCLKNMPNARFKQDNSFGN